MNTRRSAEIARGFAILGTVGFLVAAFVIPGQWQSGSVRTEAQVGLIVSAVCVLLSGLVARSILAFLRTALDITLLVSLGYSALMPFVAAEIGGTTVRWWIVTLVLVIMAVASALGIWRLSRCAAQQAFGADSGDERPST